MSYDDYINTLGEYYSLHRLHYEKFLLDEESSEIIKEYNPFFVCCNIKITATFFAEMNVHMFVTD